MGDKGVNGWRQQEVLEVVLTMSPAAAPHKHGSSCS